MYVHFNIISPSDTKNTFLYSDFLYNTHIILQEAPYDPYRYRPLPFPRRPASQAVP